MTPTEELKHEHEIISIVLNAAERKARTLKETGRIDAGAMARMVDFFINFIDRCHHTKEEKHLFKKMRDRGVPGETGPVAAMLQEHEEERRRVKALVESLSRAATQPSAADAEAIRTTIMGYVALLRSHIQKEDNEIYPLADRLFSSDDQKSLTASFRRVELEEMGEGVHEKYHEIAHGVAEE